MSNGVKRLVELLDERNEHYVVNDLGVTWSYYSDPHTATESMDGTLIVTGLTPEQVVEATLGRIKTPAVERVLHEFVGKVMMLSDVVGEDRLVADFAKRLGYRDDDAERASARESRV